MSMFSKAESERIAAAVAEVESRTAGELVVAELGRSDDYAEVRLFATVVVGLCAGAGVHLVLPAWPVGLVLGAQLAAALVTFILTGLAPVLRWLTPRGRADHAVAQAARLSFLEHGVFRTRDRTGVLIFLSALEHRVVILGDEGIHAQLRDPGWTELVATLTRAIKEGRAGDGVCEVLGRLGETLARDAPIREDDTNELANHVRTRPR